MEVLLYVYDLSQGLARQMSMQFLGIQIDAVYHTSIVLNNVEYFFGRGIQTSRAGQTHHGRPMQVVNLGNTDLPQDVVNDYLNALRETYTAESYDLFMHNCNNFSHDFAQFLVGKGIPDYITNLPRQVLNTPFGRMLQPQLDASMRSLTQAPVPGEINGAAQQPQASKQDATPSHPHDRLSLPMLRRNSSKYVHADDAPDLQLLRSAFAPEDDALIEALAFVERRSAEAAADVPLPNLQTIHDGFGKALSFESAAFRSACSELLRLLLLDVRVTTFFAENESEKHLVRHFLAFEDTADPRTNNHLALLGIACNILVSELWRRLISPDEASRTALVALIVQGLLDNERPERQLLASRVAVNLCTSQFNSTSSGPDRETANKQGSHESWPESSRIELAAALVEVLSAGAASASCLSKVVLALGRLLCRAPQDGELLETCRLLEGKAAVFGVRPKLPTAIQGLTDEVASLL